MIQGNRRQRCQPLDEEFRINEGSETSETGAPLGSRRSLAARDSQLEARSLKRGRSLRGFVCLLVLVCSVFAVGLARTSPSTAQKHHPPNVVLISPKAGDVLTPGEQVTIAWEIDAPSSSDFQGCEQEIYLSTDKGRTIAARLTPEFSFGVTSYNWTVPNLPAKKAVIIMGFGCESGPSIFESQYPQRQSIFRINKPPADFEEVKLTGVQESAGDSGKEVKLTWDSNVSNVDHFEIQVSLDAGAHFRTAGIVTGQEFTLQLPEKVPGGATIRIIAHRGDGTSVESLMSSTLRLAAMIG